ncbi:HCLS1-binding protein 3 [Terrapene carolina triunguis]|uniref:HCLS1-binding protein 3 n=1 Tax=Terrapene triunguis TaxID=2587831 RepID=A0A674IHJ6_9SAUR|nr:HCLS1-binding protein 3 [Terrapene carolina triunguis]
MQQGAAPAVLVTSRQVQNAHTGIDLSVPEYQEIHGKMMSGHVEYHIVAVTRLAAFKSAKHKPEDVVQFMVSKKYSEIDEFYQKLTAHYPQASLPPLPRKALFVGESDIRERRVVFNDIMRLIAKDLELATSPELLEFLGTKSTSVIDLKGKNVPEEEEEDEENEELDFFKEERTSDIIPRFGLVKDQDARKEEEEEEEDVDPLGIIRSKKPKKPTSPAAKEDKPKLTIFDEEVDPEEGLFGPVKDFSSSSSKKNSSAKENLKLFEDPDLGGTVKLGDSLLLPTACENKDYVLSASLKEDTEELLRVEEDLERLWRVSSKPKPRLPCKPALPKKPLITTKNNVSPAPPAKPKEDKIQTMDEVDILQYIQDNESISNQDMSLF